MPAGRILLGTSSWSEKGWVGPFYPAGTKPADFLAYYATQFATVEADNTYYRVPSRSMVQNWRERTPDGFELAAKFPRSIVHAGKGEKPDGALILSGDDAKRETHAFLDVMRELGPRCGPLVLQFPYLNKTAFATPRAFLDRLAPYLASLPRTFRYAVEVRNKNWLTEELTSVLREHQVALVLVDLVYMPHPADLELDLLTTDFTYVRLIGDRDAVEAKTKTFDHIVIDQSARLERWARLVERLQSKLEKTYAYANNHFAGHGPETIREFARRLGVRER